MQFAALVVSILITILLEMNFSHSLRRLGRFFSICQYYVTQPSEASFSLCVLEPDEGDYYESIPHGVAGVPSAQSWTDLHPPSLLSAEPMDSSPRVSPRKTPVTSPVKSRMSSPAGSPSKVGKLSSNEVNSF